MQAATGCTVLSNVLARCLLLVLIWYPLAAMVYPDGEVRAAVIGMLPEGDIMASVVSEKMPDTCLAGAWNPVTDEVRFSIASDGRVFRFWADGRIPVLEATRIDLEQNQVLLDGQPLDYIGTVHSPHDSVLHSGWQGHQWTGVVSGDPDGNTQGIAIPNHRYTLILGRLENTGQTFLCLQGEKADDQKTAARQFSLPLLF